MHPADATSGTPDSDVRPDPPFDVRLECPTNTQQLCATNLSEALALSNCLRTLGIAAQLASTPQATPLVSVCVPPRQLHKAKLVQRGFLAGLGVRR